MIVNQNNMPLFINPFIFKFHPFYHTQLKEDTPSPLQPMSKQVSFSNVAKVVLIPTRQEYDTLRDILWYNDRDYKKFLHNMYYNL